MPRTKKEAEMSEDLENQELPEEDFEEEEVEYEDEDVSTNHLHAQVTCIMMTLNIH